MRRLLFSFSFSSKLIGLHLYLVNQSELRSLINVQKVPASFVAQLIVRAIGPRNLLKPLANVWRADCEQKKLLLMKYLQQHGPKSSPAPKNNLHIPLMERVIQS